MRNLKTIAEFAKDGPLRETQLRRLILKAATNGLDADGVIVRIGRSVYLDTAKFWRWIDRNGGPPSPPLTCHITHPNGVELVPSAILFAGQIPEAEGFVDDVLDRLGLEVWTRWDGDPDTFVDFGILHVTDVPPGFIRRRREALALPPI